MTVELKGSVFKFCRSSVFICRRAEDSNWLYSLNNYYQQVLLLLFHITHLFQDFSVISLKLFVKICIQFLMGRSVGIMLLFISSAQKNYFSGSVNVKHLAISIHLNIDFIPVGINYEFSSGFVYYNLGFGRLVRFFLMAVALAVFAVALSV